MHLMDMIITYLYGLLYSDIYMKFLEGVKMLRAYSLKTHI
jgi:hypothetical protein